MKLMWMLLLFGFFGTAQNRFINIADASDYLSDTDDLQKLNSYDFSPLIKGLEEDVRYGVIGDAYKRIRVRMIDVKKDGQNPNLYHIKGKTKVGNNVEDFEGTLLVQHIRQLKPYEKNEATASVSYEGVLSGIYEFRESTARMHSGIFEGTYEGSFFITRDHKVCYHNLNLMRDAYMNNSYNGFWTDYTTKKAKICKWGDFRVPDVPYDFDAGIGEFSPMEQYNDKGWKSYRDAFINNDAKAREAEKEDWWK